MMKKFNESFYTEDFDQEMLDFIKENFKTTEVCGEWSSKSKLLAYGYFSGYFWTGGRWVGSERSLTKEQFKEKIGMSSETESQVVPKELLRTGVIVEVECPVSGQNELAMVLLDTKNGDIISGETWGGLEYAIPRILRVYQPCSTRGYLNNLNSCGDNGCAIDLAGCHLIWERKSPEQIEIDKLEKEKEVIQNKINSLKDAMKGDNNG